MGKNNLNQTLDPNEVTSHIWIWIISCCIAYIEIKCSKTLVVLVREMQQFPYMLPWMSHKTNLWRPWLYDSWVVSDSHRWNYMKSYSGNDWNPNGPMVVFMICKISPFAVGTTMSGALNLSDISCWNCRSCVLLWHRVDHVHWRLRWPWKLSFEHHWMLQMHTGDCDSSRIWFTTNVQWIFDLAKKAKSFQAIIPILWSSKRKAWMT